MPDRIGADASGKRKRVVVELLCFDPLAALERNGVKKRRSTAFEGR